MGTQKSGVMSLTHHVPFVVLACAGAVGEGDGPVKVLPVEAGGVGRAALEDHLPAQQAAVTQLIRRGPALVITLRAWHPWMTHGRKHTQTQNRAVSQR